MLKVAFIFAFVYLELYGSSAQEKAGSSVMKSLDLETAMFQCNDTFRIENAYIDALDESGSFPDETDKTPKCFVRCVLENSGVAADAKYDPARAAEVFAGERGGKPMTDLKELASGCTDRTEACPCESAYNFVKCFMEAQIKEYGSD